MAKAEVGETRQRAKGSYRKVGPGKWERLKQGGGPGAGGPERPPPDLRRLAGSKGSAPAKPAASAAEHPAKEAAYKASAHAGNLTAKANSKSMHHTSAVRAQANMDAAVTHRTAAKLMSSIPGTNETGTSHSKMAAEHEHMAQHHSERAAHIQSIKDKTAAVKAQTASLKTARKGVERLTKKMGSGGPSGTGSEAKLQGSPAAATRFGVRNRGKLRMFGQLQSGNRSTVSTAQTGLVGKNAKPDLRRWAGHEKRVPSRKKR